ncbi:MAG: hypothetical protein H8D56_19070 [Planctomycetes bacterium]|nr:hypothetical protein [Planctomycetota bacterium]MBL7144377.1 hypothetical protein [Phycisphaerae bacterium]
MELHKSLSLLAALFGLIGAVFLSKGVLALTPKAIVYLTSPKYSTLDFASKQNILSLATQKADTLCGIGYVLLAFLIQVISLIFVRNTVFLIKSRWMVFWVAMAIIAILTVVASIVNIRYRDYIALVAGKNEVKDYCTKHIKGVVESAYANGVESGSEELLDLKREDSELQDDFIKRISEYVGYSIPKDTDFSKILSDK